MSQHQYSAALVRAKCIPHCPVLVCKTGSQHAYGTRNTPVKVCCSQRYAVSQHQYSAALVRANAFIGVFPVPQACCEPGNTHVKVCCSYRCAVSQHQYFAAVPRAQCISLRPVLLCKPGSQHACGTGNAPVNICCSYSCAVSQQKCTVALT